MPCAGAGAHFVHLLRAVAQPKTAEIARLDDIALGQLLRNDLQHRFQHGHGVRTGDGAHLRDALGQLAQAPATAGLDGGVELPVGTLTLWQIDEFIRVRQDKRQGKFDDLLGLLLEQSRDRCTSREQNR